MLENNERMAVESNKRWYDKVANPPTEWLELKTSSPSYTQRYAGCNELQLWTLISKRPMVSLNANTGEATVYEPNLEGSLRVQEPYWRMVLAVFVGRIVFAVLDGCVGFTVYAVQCQSM